jgi:transposase
MRSPGTPAELQRRRLLAVQRVSEGYTAEEVADFLGVAPRSVHRWLAAFRGRGAAGLTARPAPGRPAKLSSTQEKVVRRWLTDPPAEHGFATDLWTSARLARLIEEVWGIHFHPDSLTVWLRRRGYTPQKPRRRAREQDAAAVARWLAEDWPRIKKRRGGVARDCC